MDGQSASLPEMVLAQLSQAAEVVPEHSRPAALLRRRSSHSIEIPPRPLMRLRSIEERPTVQSRRSSVVSSIQFSRKNSFCAMGPSKRLSLGPWAHYGRVSFSGLPLYQPIKGVQYENTYRLGPDACCMFNPGHVQNVLETLLRTYLSDMKYSPLTCGPLTQNLADLVRCRIKEQCPPRYRLVCNIILGQADGQGVKVASRALWDPASDSFASATYSNASLIAVAIVHGVYYE
ncbi:dynein light chain Tctex-type 4 [Gastrophryne carolinensis]